MKTETIEAPKTNIEPGSRVYAYGNRFYGEEHTVLSISPSKRQARVEHRSGVSHIVPFFDLEAA